MGSGIESTLRSEDKGPIGSNPVVRVSNKQLYKPSHLPILLTNKHGKNTLHDQQQTNGGTLEENTDQADVLTLDNQTGENTVK